jgi:hypothetical protein
MKVSLIALALCATLSLPAFANDGHHAADGHDATHEGHAVAAKDAAEPAAKKAKKSAAKAKNKMKAKKATITEEMGTTEGAEPVAN